MQLGTKQVHEGEKATHDLSLDKTDGYINLSDIQVITTTKTPFNQRIQVTPPPPQKKEKEKDMDHLAEGVGKIII